MSENTNNNSNSIEELKEKVLQEKKKKSYGWEKIQKLKDDLIQALQRQDTLMWLEIITSSAISLWCSDIHFDNYENFTIIRFRIDGILVDILRLEKKQYKLLIERIKHSSSLKLNITNIPQDWKYSLTIRSSKKLDVRVSTLPTPYWENAVCRVLDSEKNILNFEDLWFYWTTKRMLEKAISNKNGMILVTGPTGSGKTTTLYTILSKLNTREKKIITLEDPIEYQLGWIIQSEVNEKNNYTFEMWLKALLRQDPDVIMLWEIRWAETLNTATQASLTWHLVLSTLHTKSASDTLDRIINMWLKPYVLASALDTIIAQRLVRKICPHCKEEHKPSLNEVNLINQMTQEIWMPKIPEQFIKLHKWAGCEHCNNSGYKWRLWIYEIISLNDNLRDAIRNGASAQEIIKKARKWDMITMREDWILKALKWYTTIEEVISVI